MKQIPNIAHIHLDVDLNLKKWLTEDDKLAIIETSENQASVNTYIADVLSENLENILNYKSINIEFE